MSIYTHWIPERGNRARVLSVEEEATLTYWDVIPRVIQEKYEVGDE